MVDDYVDRQLERPAAELDAHLARGAAFLLGLRSDDAPVALDVGR